MSNSFSKRTLAIVIAVAVVSLGAAAALTVFADDMKEEDPSAGADSYSVSAIGHRGLVELLRKLDVPVVKSRSGSAAKAENGLLLVLEPSVSDPDAKERLEKMIAEAKTVLVVLPKWYGSAPVGSEWIDDANLLPSSEIEDVLETLGLQYRMQLVRSTKLPGLIGSELAREPRIDHHAQLVVMPVEVDAAPVWDGTGNAFVYRDPYGRDIYVLTDPDVMNNHGLRHPQNAVFTVSLIEKLRGGGPVVIDEVIHGYAQPPSLLRTLFRFPLVLATMQVLICALLAIWAAMVRFGPRRAVPPPYAPGKDFLIQNTAALLHYGGHHADALRRYLMQSVHAVRHALHAPSLPPTQMTAWLENVRKLRGGSISLLDLERDAHTADTRLRTVEVADRVYRWRMEMIDGSQHRS